MALAALIVAIVSALTALLALAAAWTWRQQQQHAARAAYSLLVSRKSVVGDKTLRSWAVANVHDSVLELRNELSAALPSLPVGYLELGSTMMMASRDHAIALREWSHNPRTADLEITSIAQAYELHIAWVDLMEKFAAEMMPRPSRVLRRLASIRRWGSPGTRG